MASILSAVRTGVTATVEVVEGLANVATTATNELEQFSKEGVHDAFAAMSDMAKGFRFEQRVQLKATLTGIPLKKEYVDKMGLSETDFDKIIAESKAELKL